MDRGVWLLRALHLSQAQPLPPLRSFSPCQTGAGTLFHPLLLSGSTWRLDEHVWLELALSFVLGSACFTLWIQSIYHLTKRTGSWAG